MTRILPGLAAGILTLAGTVATASEVSVMSFNILATAQAQGVPLQRTVDMIQAANPDIIGLQEVRALSPSCSFVDCPPAGPSVAQDLADSLGYHVYEQATPVGQNSFSPERALWANAILSRYPIVDTSPQSLGVEVDIGDTSAWVFNLHLTPAPYQPYQLLGIPFGPYPDLTTEEDAIAAATAARGPAMEALLAEIALLDPSQNVFVTGDFNEPSGLDWTQAAVDAGLHPLAVDWPTTGVLQGAGFVDGYREVFPDPVAKPAYTYSPFVDEADPNDKSDRIDFVFGRGPGLSVLDAAIYGEDGPRSDVVVTPWTSDHRAVVVDYQLAPIAAVPLPAGIWLLIGGLAPLVLMRRGKSKQGGCAA